jgi:ComF family protein
MPLDRIALGAGSRTSLLRRLCSPFFRPTVCLFCLGPLHSVRASTSRVCTGCQDNLPHPAPHACVQCAAAVDAPGLCGQCIAVPPAFDAAVAACAYAFPVSQVISQFKYGSRLSHAGWMADALAASVRSVGAANEIDWILPLPLSRTRIAERGFNQSALIAEGVARQLDIPLHRDELLRVRDTLPQVGLDHDARWKNLKGAFESDHRVAGQRIAVVDDVMTTGATLDAAAKALKKAGAARVVAWVVARAEHRTGKVAPVEEFPHV